MTLELETTRIPAGYFESTFVEVQFSFALWACVTVSRGRHRNDDYPGLSGTAAWTDFYRIEARGGFDIQAVCLQDAGWDGRDGVQA